ncbi:hypothetical protein [Natrialba asiatica]|uniref:HVO-2833 C-terminal domain-containing protein n=1 Tax=Natrialba asiatica (strain ATCC 700177 / DSM 12278 / JCM 9576 / FERM P-10747 / NBRC 102637 / 172P1) TaxID=29540 RepID=M0B2Z8_NATA1|nr:hypothetical protein [Natrialba asiatica]ELZ04927.1 hypothetical protein C481_03202 [Natrialba asiatica DSM 12278]
MSELLPATLCCHTLVIDSEARTQSYCLLLLGHVDVDRDELHDQAVKYDIDTLVEDPLTYLDTSGEQRTSRLPEWKDFQELAEDYRVTA